MGFVYPGVVKVLNFDSFGTIISCRRRMHVSHASTLRKTGRALICGSYGSQHSGQTLSI